MASNEMSELDKYDDTKDFKNLPKLTKKKVPIKRDNNLEDNWRTENSDKQCRYGNWKTQRHEHQRSGIDGNWRIKNGENPEIHIQDSWMSTRDHKGPSEIFKKKKVYLKTEVNGCWRIKSNILKESKVVRNAVWELHIDLPHLFPVPPRIWSFKKHGFIEHIEAFTSPSCNETEIKAAADAIREKVYFPFVMLYFEAPVESSKLQKYQHTPENEFYGVENGLWKIILSEDDSIVSSDKDESSSKDSKCEISLSFGVKLDTLGSFEIKDSLASSSSANEVLLPSKVIDQEYIYFPPTEDAISNMRSRIGGKWLVYAGFGLAKQDDMWNKLLPLCTEGILIGMKASTATISEAQEFMDGEVILCYTENANDMNAVKKAGDAIRNVLRMYLEVSKYMLYYKTNASSEEGRYKREGCKSVTSYMHTVKGTFYVRDQFNRWTLPDF